jgi:hypothetical protein
MRYALLLSFFCFSVPLFAQYTTAAQYAVRVEKNLAYGAAVNYTGATDTLKLDLYKPVGDGNRFRPLLVLVHGGSWLGGCKEDMQWLAEEMAGRGYAVACVNYRLGWHKAASVAQACGTQDFPDVFPSEYDALYAADSCEILRAIYRGQQDVKGAIRRLKARHLEDSTCTQAVLVGGESAGAFLSLAVGFLDRPEEKPNCCAALAPAPVPSPNTLNASALNCVQRIWPINETARQRPDLGPVDGALNTGNGYDSNVQGVLSFYGAVPSVALQQNWLQGPDTPAVYFYHQTCDVVVPFNYGQPFFPLSGICNGFANCSPWHQYTPNVFGNGAIAALFASLPSPPLYTADWTVCDPFNTDLGILACLAFAQNGSYHFVANRPLRAQNAANFMNPVVNSGVSTCIALGMEAHNVLTGLQVAPNPFLNTVGIYAAENLESPLRCTLSDVKGRLLRRMETRLGKGYNPLFEDLHLPTGMYLLKVEGHSSTQTWKIWKSQ